MANERNVQRRERAIEMADLPGSQPGNAQSNQLQTPPLAQSPHQDIQRRFICSVCVLLWATAALKLVSIAMSWNLTMRPDPVFPFVSARLTLWAAILAELGAARLLSSHASLQIKGFAILWLATVFTLYCVSWSLSVDASEPCPCLGFFVQHLGISAKTGNVISALVLCWFFLVSIMALASPSRFIRQRRDRRDRSSGEADAHPAAATARVIPLILLGSLLWQGSASAALQSLQVQGRVEIRYIQEGQNENAVFSFWSDGARLLIKTVGSANPDLSGREFYYDGRLGHTLALLSPDRLAPTIDLDPETKEPVFNTNRLVRPRNDANLYLRESPIPHASGAVLIPIWLAFGSGPYWERIDGVKMEKLFDLSRTERRSPLLVPYRLETADPSVKLPKLLITLDENSSRTTTNEVFRVEQWHGELHSQLPTRFQFEIYESHRSPKGELLTVMSFVVTNISHTFGDQLQPSLEGSVTVSDERFSQDQPPLRRVEYWITNGIVPPKTAVIASSAYRAAIDSERAGSIPPIQRLWQIILITTILFPLAWIGWWITEKNKKTK